MHEHAQTNRPFGKAVLLTIFAAGALVALNPLFADSTQINGPIVVQVAELA